jgi:general stress protein 26
VKAATLTVAALLLAVSLPQAQATAPPRDAVLKTAREVIAAARYATLATIDDLGGYPYSRVVDPFDPEADFTIWIGTNASTRKVQQIERNPRVSLLYFDAPKQHYVSITGSAVVVRDPAEKARRFKPEWQAFYKNGSSGEDYVLLKVSPLRLEIVAESLGMKNDPATWQPVTIYLP